MTALVDLTSPALATATDLEHEPPGDTAWWWRDARGESLPDGDHRRLTVDEAVEVAAGHLRGVPLGPGWRCEPVPWRVR